MVKDKKVKKDQPGDTTQFFALKVQKSAEHYTEAAMDEVELLDCVAAERDKVSDSSLTGKDINGIPWEVNIRHSKHIAMLKDSFFHTGPNGKHMCMVFHMLGCNLLSVIKAYDYRGVPISAVKSMVKGICQGLDFLHRKCQIIHTDLKPENVLLEFPLDEDDQQEVSVHDYDQAGNDQSAEKGITIEELEETLKDPKLSSDERKKIKKKIKKRKQKEKNKLESDENTTSRYDREVNELADRLSGLSPGDTNVPDILPILSDIEMERILDHKRSNPSWNSESLLSSNTGGNDSLSSSQRVLKRLNHSPFVALNFSSQQNAGSLIEETFRELASVKSADEREVKSQLYNNDGLAEITFLLRAYVPEGEIADNVSKALGIDWKRSEEKGLAREW